MKKRKSQNKEKRKKKKNKKRLMTKEKQILNPKESNNKRQNMIQKVIQKKYRNFESNMVLKLKVNIELWMNYESIIET